MVQISSYFLALKVDTDVSLLFQRGCSWPSWMGVSVEGQGWTRAPIGLLLLRGGVVGGAGCCSLLFSETIKWTVISPGCLHVSFQQHVLIQRRIQPQQDVAMRLTLFFKVVFIHWCWLVNVTHLTKLGSKTVCSSRGYKFYIQGLTISQTSTAKAMWLQIYII